ncbi:MAG: hypothetical protein ACRDPF_39955 [Streptosporangiaceae bacterium]
MGRASNRKKAQRQAGPEPQPDAATQEAMLKVLTGLQAMAGENEERRKREATARWIWSGGAEPVPAVAAPWREDSLGDRFFGGHFLREAQKAPCLASADIPDAAAIAAHPAHWNVATQALIRAVVYDGLGPDHPAVSTVLEVLAPIAEAELAYGEADQPSDAELPQPIGDVQGDALVNLIRAGVVKPRDILPVGLRLLSALAQLCRSNSPSLLQPAARS